MNKRLDNPAVVRLDRVSKTYGVNGKTNLALKPTNIEFHSGEFVLLLGPSGSGKTTLLTIIAGFQQPTGGDVYLFDRQIHTYGTKELQKLRAKSIGFVFQQFHLIESLTVLENILLVVRFSGKRKLEGLKVANELLEKFGVNHLRDIRPVKLSQGEKQRIALIRALVNNAPLIIADEPTGNLSTDQGMVIVNYLKESVINENRLVIVSSHDDRIIKFADRVLYIKDGNVTDR